MNSTTVLYGFVLLVLLLIALLQSENAHAKKVIIHVPYRVKNVKHTHTVYRLVPYPHGSKHSEEDDKYDLYWRR